MVGEPEHAQSTAQGQLSALLPHAPLQAGEVLWAEPAVAQGQGAGAAGAAPGRARTACRPCCPTGSTGSPGLIQSCIIAHKALCLCCILSHCGARSCSSSSSSCCLLLALSHACSAATAASCRGCSQQGCSAHCCSCCWVACSLRNEGRLRVPGQAAAASACCLHCRAAQLPCLCILCCCCHCCCQH